MSSRKFVLLLVILSLAATGFLCLGIIIERSSARVAGQRQELAKPVTATGPVVYTSARQMWDRLDHSSLRCPPVNTAIPPRGTYMSCSLSQHKASLWTLEPPDKPKTTADFPFVNESGQKLLVITGQNWEVFIVADSDPEVNKLLVDHVAKTLGGTIISGG